MPGWSPRLPLWLSLRAMIRAHAVAKARGAAQGLPYLDRRRRCWRRRRPGWSRSAGCRAPASRAWPAPWPRRSAPRPARWCCAATRSASAGPGWRRSSGCRAAAYTPEASAAVFAELAGLAAEALRGGHAVIADAAFLRPRSARRSRPRAAARPSTGFWLEAPLAVLRARVAARRGDASDADAAVLAAAAARDPGPIAWQRLDAAARTLLRRHARHPGA